MTGTFKFPIKSSLADKVIFEAELDARHKAQSHSVQLGMATKIAVEAGANLGGANLYGANLYGANLGKADLRYTDLRGANLRGANLGVADLRGANLGVADLRGANLRGAYLRYANLYGANLGVADLRGVNLRGAYLRGAYLRGADLSEADLCGVNLRGVNLSEAIGIANRIIYGGIRSDGYRFLLTRTEPEEWRVKAGCRNFTLTEARKHWGPDHKHTAETNLIINHMTALAKLREWPETGEEA